MATTPESVLIDFIVRPDRPPDALGYHALLGFLFTMASAPEPVTPPEWMPLVSVGWGLGCATPDEARNLTAAMTTVLTAMEADVVRDQVALPKSCPFRTPAEANLAAEAPMAQWCEGFRVGHQFLEGRWKQRLPKRFREQYEAYLITLSFFESPTLARDLCRTTRSDLQETARCVVEIFEHAMAGYAQLGWSLRQLPATGPVLEPTWRGGSKVGRNDPCPCGSGRKYKKCCGAAV